jgi:hypothetical protein
LAKSTTLQELKTFFIPKNTETNKLLEGDICTYNAFIEKGFYARILLMKRNEHIIQFAFEGWWISDLSSFLMGKHSI